MVFGLWRVARNESVQGHFLAGHSAAWPRIGFSLYASTIGVTSLVGLTGTAYAHGISVFAYEWMAALVFPVFCAFVLPTYLRSNVFTVPEFLELRYGQFVRKYVSALSIVLDIVLEAAAVLFGGAVVFRIMVPDWPLWAICTLLAGLSGIFLIAGGLRAVIRVESIQGIVMVTVCACLAGFAFHAAGGIQQALRSLDPVRLKLIMPASDTTMPWIGLVTGVPLIGFYYWCTNQTMVQRALAARTLDHGRWGTLFAGALKLTNLFLVILPGAVAVLIYPNLANADQVFPTMVFSLLPPGLIGLLLAACLISILSCLASVYNSTATLLTMDFIRRMRPGLSDRQLIFIGRGLTVILMGISILWAPQIGNFKDTLWQYLQAIMSYFVPPIAAVFVAGFFFPRANAMGAACGLVVGTVASFVGFLGIEILGIIPIHFQVAAVLIFLLALASVLMGSLMAPAPDITRIASLMFSRMTWRAETLSLKSRPFYKNYRYLSLALMALTGAIVIWFW